MVNFMLFLMTFSIKNIAHSQGISKYFKESSRITNSILSFSKYTSQNSKSYKNETLDKIAFL